MELDNFQKGLLEHTEEFRKILATLSGDWSVKGFIVQEKYKIAKDRPGSGNTKNIGSCVKISELKEGMGPFSKLGVKVFDDYWMNYMTAEMSRSAKLRKPPYANLKEYLKYRNIKNV